MGIWTSIKESVTSNNKKDNGKAIVERTGSLNYFTTEETPEDRYDLYQWYLNCYNTVPVVSAIVNIQADQATQDFYFEGPATKELTAWSDKINLSEFFHVTIKNKLIFGNSYCEVVMKGDEIIKLKVLNPVWIDAYRDKVGRIIGYSQTIDNNKMILWGTTGNFDRDSPFQTKYTSINNIIHFKHNVIGSDKYGRSVIQPIITSIQQKLMMEKNLGKLLKKYVAPLIWAKVGSNEMPAQAAAVQTVAGTLKDLHAESEIVTSHLVELSVLDFNSKGMDIKTPIAQVEQQIITGGQVPPLLLGRSDAGVEKGADVQLRSFGRRIKSIQRETRIEFEDNILMRFNLGGLDDRLVWTKAEEREWEIDTDIIRGLVTDGVITAQKANDLLPPKFQEQLPEPIDPMGMGVEPRPTQRKDGKLVSDNPNDPTQTTKVDRTNNKRMSKKDIAIPQKDEKKNGKGE